MPRIACLVVPRFAVASLRRAEPELRGCPVVVCASLQPHAPVLDVSAEAARFAIRPGQTIVQALARHADLVVRPLDGEALAGARTALADVALSVSPRVESAGGEARGDTIGSGIVHLDADGLERLFGSPAGILTALVQRGERIGFEAGGAIADGKATARIAAGLAARRGENIVVPPGGDANWLAPLSIAALSPVFPAIVRAVGKGEAGRSSWPALEEEFRRLGIVRLGDLAALSPGSVATRFGKVAARLWRVAAGRDDAPLAPDPLPLDVVEGASLEHAVDSLEALLFVVRGLLDRIVGRLRLHGVACRGLAVALGLVGGARCDREVSPLAPTCDVKTLALLTRSALEAAPPGAAVESIRLTAVPDRPRPDQLDLFRNPGPAPERLATTLARLASLCGPGRVGRPVAPAGHRPEDFRLVPFTAPGSARSERSIPSGDAPRRLEPPALALRALRPPRPAEVFLEGGRIAYVRAPGLGGRAIVVAGPWRVEAEWWKEPPCRRDYYEVQLSDGGLYRLYRTPGEDGWLVDGYYD